jgi:hypothetical protein
MKLVKTAAFGRICQDCYTKNIADPEPWKVFEASKAYGKCNVCQRG